MRVERDPVARSGEERRGLGGPLDQKKIVGPADVRDRTPERSDDPSVGRCGSRLGSGREGHDAVVADVDAVEFRREGFPTLIVDESPAQTVGTADGNERDGAPVKNLPLHETIVAGDEQRAGPIGVPPEAARAVGHENLFRDGFGRGGRGRRILRSPADLSEADQHHRDGEEGA